MIPAIEYTRRVGEALRIANLQTDLYAGKEGCLRLAREYGSCLSDYSKKEAKDALQSSYALICVVGYSMRPPVDAREWVKEVEKAMMRRYKP